MIGAPLREASLPLRPLEIGLEERAGWRHYGTVGGGLWLKGWIEGARPASLAAQLVQLAGQTPERIGEALAGLHGHFALIAVGLDAALAVVDRIRSVPLIHGRSAQGVPVIDQEGGRLSRCLGLGPHDAEPDQALAVGMAGFTVGDGTLYRGVRQIGPGTFVRFRAGEAVHGRYHRFDPWRPEAAPRDLLRSRLERLTLEVLERLAASADGRPIAVPISAGCDSRLIASGLRHIGYKRLVAFAYGRPGNTEAETSLMVAERLGIPWRFVPFSLALMRWTYAEPDHARHVASADSLTGVHFPQDYPALKALLAEGFLTPETIVVNGQSGDFITGNHVPAALRDPPGRAGAEERGARIVDALIAKHFKQWGALSTAANLARIRRLLAREIEAVGGLPDDPAGDHGLYEWCEFQDRQSKYVVNGQRAYEHFGLDWRLPLWDDAYLEFWARAPLEAKAGQSLYREMLAAANFGDVWRTIPINRKPVRPRWLIAPRLLCKALHAPLGPARWHRFERRAFGYWMNPLCSGALVSYRRALLDRRGPRGAVAWHIEAYLGAKGLALDGTPFAKPPP
jgi:asparagine synthase (glutamine-hydrolysing)